MNLDPEETILLTKEDIEKIESICANPPAPSAALVEAAQRYRDNVLVGQQVESLR